MNFKLKRTKETYIDPVNAVCKVGQYDGTQTRWGNLCICREGIQPAFLYINSIVLRQAILSNPSLFQSACGIVPLEKRNHDALLKKNKDLDNENKKLKEKLSKLQKAKKVVEVTE